MLQDFPQTESEIIMSYSDKGITDIYRMNIKKQNIIRITNSPSIDTSPSFSPDGKQIVFNSDRGGTQQIYIMNENGRNVKEFLMVGEDMQHQCGLQKGI